MKVLVVDDSKAMRMIVIRTLKQSGIANLTTVEAGNGLEGLAMVAEHKPQAICCDWNMPEMKGIDFLKKLMGVRPMPARCTGSRNTNAPSGWLSRWLTTSLM